MKWFRFYHDAIDDPKVQRLPGDLFKFWVNMLCLASRSSERGVVKLDLPEIAFAMRLEDDEAEAMIGELCRRNLLEECVEGLAIHNWDSRQFKSDSSAERVARHRRNAAATPPETDPEGDVTAGVTLQDSQRNDPVTPKPSVNTDSETDSDTEAEENGGADAPPPKKPARKPAAKRTALPDDFGISDRLLKWAGEVGFTVEEMEDQLPRFQNNARMKQPRYADWDAAFQNWMKNAEDWGHLDKFRKPKNITPFQSNGHRRPANQRGYSADELMAKAIAGMKGETR